MAVKIRLARHGAKKRPYYRIVVADSRCPRDGKFIEEVGRYNPCTEPAMVQFDLEKVDQWIKNGAQPTDTVASLLKTEDIVGLVESVVRPLVEFPDDLEITSSDAEDGSILVEVRVNEEDAGKVIGRQGRVIKAIRTLARAAASRTNTHVEVELLD